MLSVDKLAIKLGNFSLEDISFTLEKGQYGVLMGKTGCGKSSILEAICGLCNGVKSGKTSIAGRDVTNEKPAYRGIGYMPQDLALFPSMTVREQLGFALEIRGVKREIVDQRVQELCELLEIKTIIDRYPKHLSGGELQRVALGRALSFSPSLLCLDEPLSAVDEETRDELCQLLKNIQQQMDVTILHVTHSSYEAQRLADVVLKLKDGVLGKEVLTTEGKETEPAK